MSKRIPVDVSADLITLPTTLVKEFDPTQLAVYCRLLCESTPDMQVRLHPVEMSEDIGISQIKLKEILSQFCRLDYFVKGSLITIINSGFSSDRIIQIHGFGVTK